MQFITVMTAFLEVFGVSQSFRNHSNNADLVLKRHLLMLKTGEQTVCVKTEIQSLVINKS